MTSNLYTFRCLITPSGTWNAQMKCGVGIWIPWWQWSLQRLLKMNQIPPLCAKSVTISQTSTGRVRLHHMTFKWRRREGAWNRDGQNKVTQEALLLQAQTIDSDHVHVLRDANLFSSWNKQLQSVSVDNISWCSSSLAFRTQRPTQAHSDAAYTTQCTREEEYTIRIQPLFPVSAVSWAHASHRGRRDFHWPLALLQLRW